MSLARRPYIATLNCPATDRLVGCLIEEGDQDLDIRETHWKAFAAHCQANNFSPCDQFQDAIPSFAASLLLQHRCAATVKVYLKHVKMVFDESRTRFSTVMRALDHQIARQGSIHAVDLNNMEISPLLHIMYTSGDRFIAIVCAFLWITGMRCEDVTELRRKHVELGDTFLRVEIRFAKNIRSRLDATELRIPIDWLPSLPKDIIIDLSRHLQEGSGNDALFPSISADRVNRNLRVAWPRCGVTVVGGRLFSNDIYVSSIIHSLH